MVCNQVVKFWNKVWVFPSRNLPEFELIFDDIIALTVAIWGFISTEDHAM